MLDKIVEFCLGIVIIIAFIPVFTALNSDFHILQTLLESLEQLFQALF